MARIDLPDEQAPPAATAVRQAASGASAARQAASDASAARQAPPDASGTGRAAPRTLGRDALRLACCALGAAAGLGLALSLVAPPASPLLFASLGGSAVFLFGMTRAPAAQPRALFGGHLGGALVGIVCFQSFGDAIWVYALALAVTLLYMLLTKTMHPPAGANPLLMIAAHGTYAELWQPVLVGVLSLAAVAVVWSRLVPGVAHYPVMWLDPSPPTTFWGGWGD